jgi:hypothetical protein
MLLAAGIWHDQPAAWLKWLLASGTISQQPAASSQQQLKLTPVSVIDTDSQLPEARSIYNV